MSDRLSELEIKAKHGDDMPDGLTQSEQLYSLAMVQLYKLFNSHVYDRSQAKSIKQISCSRSWQAAKGIICLAKKSCPSTWLRCSKNIKRSPASIWNNTV